MIFSRTGEKEPWEKIADIQNPVILEMVKGNWEEVAKIVKLPDYLVDWTVAPENISKFKEDCGLTDEEVEEITLPDGRLNLDLLNLLENYIHIHDKVVPKLWEKVTEIIIIEKIVEEMVETKLELLVEELDLKNESGQLDIEKFKSSYPEEYKEFIDEFVYNLIATLYLGAKYIEYLLE